MICRKFVWSKDKKTGEMGWLLKGVPNFNVASPMTIAHDILEHRRYDKGTVEEELQAFGAYYLIRVESGWVHERPFEVHYNNVHYMENSIGDLITDAYIETGGELRLETAPNVAKDCDIGETFYVSAVKGIDQGFRELDNYHYDSEEPITLDESVNAKNIENWVMKGFKHALKRYAKCPDVKHLFEEIMKAAEEAGEGWYEGQELKIRYDIRTCNVRWESEEY